MNFAIFLHLAILLVVFIFINGTEGRPSCRTDLGQTEDNPKPKLVVVDVDTGLDDAWGLVQLLAAQRKGLVRVLAVTTESGNTNLANVLRNTLRTLQVSGFPEVPVYRGVPNPIIECNRTCNYYGCDGFCNVEFKWEPDLRQIQLNSAPQALVRLAAQYPGEISLICTASLLNIAAAMKRSSTFTSNLKEMVIMGGHYPDQSPQFNFELSPESANLVVTRAQCPITLLVSEACNEAGLSLEWGIKAFSHSRNPPIEMLYEIEVAYSNINANQSIWHMDDLYLASYFLNKEVAETSVYFCGSVVVDGPLAGTLITNSCEKPRLKIITKLDEEKLRREVLESKQI